MISKIAIIGSNSFSGASFANYMSTLGCEVLCFSRSPELVEGLLPYKWNIPNTCRFIRSDINHDLNDLEAHLDREKIKYVFNFAAQSMVGQSWDKPEDWFMTNSVSTIKLHNILKNKDYLERYVHISTPEVYGNCNGYVNENNALNPSTPYAVSRAAADMSLKTFFNVYQFPYVSTRAANVFGPGQQLYRIIPKTIMFIKLGKRIPLHGGGYSERSFIHINDVASATLKIAERGTVNNVYHIATEQQITIRDLVTLICRKMGASFESVVETSEDRKGKDAAYVLDSSKIRNELGWRDLISLENGIDETIEWVNRYFEQLKEQPFNYIHKS